jgi:hypothetical protein
VMQMATGNRSDVFAALPMRRPASRRWGRQAEVRGDNAQRRVAGALTSQVVGSHDGPSVALRRADCRWPMADGRWPMAGHPRAAANLTPEPSEPAGPASRIRWVRPGQLEPGDESLPRRAGVQQRHPLPPS